MQWKDNSFSSPRLITKGKDSLLLFEISFSFLVTNMPYDIEVEKTFIHCHILFELKGEDLNIFGTTLHYYLFIPFFIKANFIGNNYKNTQLLCNPPI